MTDKCVGEVAAEFLDDDLAHELQFRESLDRRISAATGVAVTAGSLTFAGMSLLERTGDLDRSFVSGAKAALAFFAATVLVGLIAALPRRVRLAKTDHLSDYLTEDRFSDITGTGRARFYLASSRMDTLKSVHRQNRFRAWCLLFSMVLLLGGIGSLVLSIRSVDLG